MKPDIDIEALRTLYNSDDKAQSILDYFAERKRAASESKVDSLVDTMRRLGVTMTRGNVVNVLKALEAIGCGEFKYGRKGHVSRMVWHLRLTDVGLLATGEEASLDQDDAGALDDGDSESVIHQFLLRPDVPIEIELPLDITSVEAARMAGFIQSLPFEQT